MKILNEKPLMIAEIGLNHMGSVLIARKYLDFLCNSQVDGISFQIKKDDFYKNLKFALKSKDKNFSKEFRNTLFFEKFMKNKNKKLSLHKNFYKYAVKKCNQNKKLIGFAIQETKQVDFFNSLNIDFYKILNADLSNENLIRKIGLNKKVFKILSVSNNAISEIKKSLSFLNKKKILISITDFNKKANIKTYRNIRKYKKKFNLPVGYGNHSEIKSLKKALNYGANFLLFYVKLKHNRQYPDDNNAILLSKLNKILF